MSKRHTIALAVYLVLAIASIHSQAFLDIEGGIAFPVYNDVAIPAGIGTKFSLTDDVSSELAPAIRLRLGYTFAGRHTVSALYAPLTVRGSGTLDRDISFRGKTFARGSDAETVYRFDSYRLTYRYAFIATDTLNVGAGITGKIRSADIAIMNESGYAHRSDLGIVPLVNFRAQWVFAKPFSAAIDADALASTFGRAEDLSFALQYAPSDRVCWRLGYRILEGGSDGGGNVYTFALFNYVMAGISVSL
jgi:hypothetical protein